MALGKAASKGVKRYAKKKERVLANRAAQDQKIFGAQTSVKRKMQEARNGTKVALPESEYKSLVSQQAQAKSTLQRGRRDGHWNENNKLTGAEMDEYRNLNQQIRQMQQSKQTVPAELTKRRSELQGILQDRASTLSTAREVASTPVSGFRDMTQMDRWKLRGSAAAEYMWGGTGKQIVARNGAVLGGIVGVPIAADAIDSAINNGGGGRPQGY